MTGQQDRWIYAGIHFLSLVEIYTVNKSMALLQWLQSCKSDCKYQNIFHYPFLSWKATKVKAGRPFFSFMSWVGIFFLFLLVLQAFNSYSPRTSHPTAWKLILSRISTDALDFSATLPWGHWFWSISSQCLLTATLIKGRQGEVII